jgi:hypothetical protein
MSYLLVEKTLYFNYEIVLYETKESLNNVFISGEFSTIGQWTSNPGEEGELHLDDMSLGQMPVALRQKKQILKVQTVTVKLSLHMRLCCSNCRT